MGENTVLIAVLTILSIHFLYKKYVEATKDVPDLYLSEQSIIDGTRLTNQSAIYKSNKLDYGNGLRVGLDIRYDHYKLRNGNFCDIWELLINGLKKDPLKWFQLNNDVISIKVLNFKVEKLGQYLLERDITSVAIKYNEFLSSMDNLILVFTCLINSIVLTFYDDIDNLQGISPCIEVIDLSEINQFISSLPDKELSTYENLYHFDKDKGVRVRINQKLNNKIITNTEYLTVNFVSSISSTLRHLPFNESITNKDNLLIISSNNQDLVTYVLSKILLGFVCNCNITVIDNQYFSYKSWDQSLEKYNPSVLFMDHYIDETLIEGFKQNLSLLDKLKFKQGLNLLSKGKFSKFNSLPLRLIFFNKGLRSITTPIINPLKLNELRAILNCRIITEYSYPNLIGPMVLNDFYDYRILASNITRNLIGYGCIFQSIEIKLINIDDNNYGDIMIRGYNIGKVNNYLIGKGMAERINKDNEGFMMLENVKGKWGNDGCLYVYSN